jgi:hypothetical protein
MAQLRLALLLSIARFARSEMGILRRAGSFTARSSASCGSGRPSPYGPVAAADGAASARLLLSIARFARSEMGILRRAGSLTARSSASCGSGRPSPYGPVAAADGAASARLLLLITRQWATIEEIFRM